MRRWWRGASMMVGAGVRASPRRLAVMIGATVFSAVAGTLGAWWLKVLTDGVVARDVGKATLGALGLATAGTLGAMVLNAVAGPANKLMDETLLILDVELLSLTTNLPGIEHHERPDYLDRLNLLRSERALLGSYAFQLVNALGLVVRMGTTVILLAEVHVVLLLLPVFALPTLATSAAARRHDQRVAEELAERTRLLGHLVKLTTDAGSAAEVRVFGLGRKLAHRTRQAHDDLAKARLRSLARGEALRLAGSLIFMAGYVLAILFVAHRAVRGAATPGDVLLTLTLAGQVAWLTTSAAGVLTSTMTATRAVGRYLWLYDYARSARTEAVDAAPVPGRLTHGIDFDDVSFTYPGTEAAVLRHVDLHLPAGASVAVVGENGAGKTTLVKLLCRFYEPSSGHIRVDGIDLARFEPVEWRSRQSACFQDFARLEFLVRETVGVGDLDRIDDATAVGAALAQADAEDLARVLPAGLETQLGLGWDDGVELSGGQWQKLALARGMMRAGPLLLVLDEPTSALDAEAEHALFERYAWAAKEAARRNGGVTVLVSHRFSTARHADVIVVLEHGEVAEVGTHRELVEAGGLYAELYALHTQGYR